MNHNANQYTAHHEGTIAFDHFLHGPLCSRPVERFVTKCGRRYPSVLALDTFLDSGSIHVSLLPLDHSNIHIC